MSLHYVGPPSPPPPLCVAALDCPVCIPRRFSMPKRHNPKSVVGEVRPCVADAVRKCAACGATLRSLLDSTLHWCHWYYTSRRGLKNADGLMIHGKMR